MPIRRRAVFRALWFAGTGPGRVGSSSLIPNWHGEEPRLGFAYAINDKTTIRGSASRYLRTGGRKQRLFALPRICDQVDGRRLDQRHPTALDSFTGSSELTQPPFIDPSVANGQSSIPYWNGASGNTPSAELGYSFDVQRQVTSTSVLSAGYMATLASDLPSNILAVNQVPYRSLPASLSPFTATGRAARAR